MWTESSSVNYVNLVNISAAIPEISNFSKAVTFGGTLYTESAKMTK